MLSHKLIAFPNFRSTLNLLLSWCHFRKWSQFQNQ